MHAKEQIRIAFVEDNSISRRSFMEKARMIPEWKIVFTAENGSEFMEQLRLQKPSGLPDVVFMDLEMPVINGSQAIAMAKSIYPNIAFIALTMFDDDDKIFDAIKAGACGYLLKHEAHSVLKEAVVSVLEFGGSPMSPAIARKALQLLSKSSMPEVKKDETALPDIITEREREVLQLTVQGWDAKQIADSLNISTFTVRKHIANIYEKLQVRSKAQIIQIAHKNNWYK
jgi:DNA-binding NarL/FixJ family response regulator